MSAPADLLDPPQHSPVSTVSKPKKPSRVTAESMAERQRDISVSEFFAKNRHLLGFDNPRKALLTTVKEAVDNSLDACEEAGILPDVVVNRNVKLRRAVVDKSCVLPEGLTVGFNPEEDRRRFHVSERGITLITPEMLGQEVFHQR